MKVLITRPRAQADDFAEKLRSVGFEPIFFPVIEIQPIENNVALERALEKLNCYEWVYSHRSMPWTLCLMSIPSSF
jgi:uroporphyrinogen-III synthase